MYVFPMADAPHPTEEQGPSPAPMTTGVPDDTPRFLAISAQDVYKRQGGRVVVMGLAVVFDIEFTGRDIEVGDVGLP